MNNFLKEREFLFDRVKAGIDVHPSQQELEQFEQLATQISPNGAFPWRGCQECVNHMVKFVFENADKLEKKQRQKTETPQVNEQ